MNRAVLVGVAITTVGAACWLAVGRRALESGPVAVEPDAARGVLAPPSPPSLAVAARASTAGPRRGRCSITGLVRRNGNPEAARVEASKCLFVDDLEANIAGARNAGFPCHLFKDTDTLRAALLERGW